MTDKTLARCDPTTRGDQVLPALTPQGVLA